MTALILSCSRNQTQNSIVPPATVSHSSNTDTVNVYSLSEVVKLTEPIVVRIEACGSTGSGIITNKAGYILTCSHLVTDCSTVKISLVGADEVDGIVLYAYLVNSESASLTDLSDVPIALSLELLHKGLYRLGLTSGSLAPAQSEMPPSGSSSY